MRVSQLIKSVTVVILFWVTLPAQANLITNGSFETPTLTPGSDYVIATVGGSTIPGWSVVGPTGLHVAIVEALYDLPDSAGINFAAADGVQWIDLAGAGANTYEGLLQSFSLTPDTYSLSFYIGNVVDPASGLGTQSAVDLLINGIQVQSFANSGSGGTGINWQKFTYEFSGSGLTTIEFRNLDGATDNLNGLDNVVLAAVQQPTTAVPEPSTIALLIAGFLSLLVLFNNRRYKINTIW